MTFDVWSLALQIATLLAVIVAAWQLLFHSRQMHREFEALYVARYWEIMDRRSDSWVLSGRTKRSDSVVARSYLQLCEDEIDCRRIGRVTDNTWVFWRDAILSQTSAAEYKRALADSGADEYPLLQKLRGLGPGYDPLEHRWLWRKTHGL